MRRTGRQEHRTPGAGLTLRRAPALLVLAALLLPISVWAGSRYVNPAALHERIESDNPPLVIDVRGESDYLIAHVPTAINIPHTELEDRVAELKRRAPDVVAVYDEFGPRSRRAKEILVKAGFGDVLNLEGGFANWKHRGFPTER